jgi:GNAT superfamily N-acetyltransferase
MSTIALATTERQIERCFAVMSELRPHLVGTDFVARVKRQQGEGFKLAFLSDRKQVKSVAGFRVLNSLSWGTFLYVDDLVTAEDSRSRGHGQKLFAWLLREARRRGCDELHLDSGVHRFGAHRFYLARRMDIIGHHFALKL